MPVEHSCPANAAAVGTLQGMGTADRLSAELTASG